MRRHGSFAGTLALASLLWASGAGDGGRLDDSYGWLDHSYYTGGTTLGAYRQYWQPGWGKEDSFFEIPISALDGLTVTAASLVVESLGFSTGYDYGSASIAHLNPTGAAPTGDIVVDQPHGWGGDYGWEIYNSSPSGPNNDGTPGTKSYDVTAALLADLAAGRSWATFAMSASRDTYGSIYASETEGQGPRLLVTYEGAEVMATPLPGALWLLGSALFGLGGLGARRRSRAGQ
jgi:hypothetical protein